MSLHACPTCGVRSSGAPAPSGPEVSNVDIKQCKMSVRLTVQESQGLRMALMFGAPTPHPTELQSAYRKLLEGERLAGHAV